MGYFYPIEGEVTDCMGRQMVCNTVQIWPLIFENPPLMKFSLGVQRKNSFHHLSFYMYGENLMSPNQTQPGQTLNDHHGLSTVSDDLPALPHLSLSQLNKEALESRGSMAQWLRRKTSDPN